MKLLDGARILVVDDEPDARALVAECLRGAGAITDVAGSAGEAMRELGKRPDLILSDLSMPDVDGYQLIRRVRARGIEQGGNTLAIALTGCVGVTDHTRALLSGFQLHLAKPIRGPMLVQAIHHLLAQRSSIR